MELFTAIEQGRAVKHFNSGEQMSERAMLRCESKMAKRLIRQVYAGTFSDVPDVEAKPLCLDLK